MSDEKYESQMNSIVQGWRIQPPNADKRFQAAVAAMQGLMAGPQYELGWLPEQIAQEAVEHADALLAELAKEQP